MSDDDDKKDYEVGYGKPPKSTRFGAINGNPRNAKGRPPGRTVLEFSRLSEEALWDCFLQAAQRPVTLTEEGGEVEIPYVMVLARRMAQDALKGDRHARRDLLRMLEKATKGTDKMQLELYATLADHEERRIKASAKLGSREFFDAKYAHYMARKHLRKTIGGPEFMYLPGEPITDEDWAMFMTEYERLKTDPDLVLPWPPKYSEDAEAEKIEKMSIVERTRYQLDEFLHRYDMRKKEGLIKWPYLVEEPHDEKDWDHYTLHMQDKMSGKENPRPWPPAYWDDEPEED